MVDNHGRQTRSRRNSVQVAPSEEAIEAGRSVKTDFKLRKNQRLTIESESVRTSRRKCVPSDRFSYSSPLTLCPSADLTACYRPARRSNTTCNVERDDDEDDELDGMVGLFPNSLRFFLSG